MLFTQCRESIRMQCWCIKVCVCMCFGRCVYLCQKEQTRKLQLVKQQRLAEKKPSTLNNQSSLLSIYNVLHYITIPLACIHLHIPVTSLQRLLIINGSHMLPGAPYYRIITVTQKAKKNGNYVDMKWSTKPIKGSAFIDSVSWSQRLNEYHLHTRVVVPRWQPSAGRRLVCRVHFWDTTQIHVQCMQSIYVKLTTPETFI